MHSWIILVVWICWALQFTGSMKLIKSTQTQTGADGLVHVALCSLCLQSQDRLQSSGAVCFAGGSWSIQRLLWVESHIKVNLAPSALALPSTNLLSVWWGSWTGSPFQNRGANLPNLSRPPPPSPSPDCMVKVKEVKDAYMHQWSLCWLLWGCAQHLDALFSAKWGFYSPKYSCHVKTTLVLRWPVSLVLKYEKKNH